MSQGDYKGGREVLVRRSGIGENERQPVMALQLQPPQRGGAVSEPVWVGSKWLLAFPRVPVTLGTPLGCFFNNIVLYQYIITLCLS